MNLPPVLRLAFLSVIALGLSACGAGQAIHDGTVNTFKRVSTGYVDTARIELSRVPPSGTREDAPMDAIVVRVYQLRAPDRFMALSDDLLLTDDQQELKADLLASENIQLRSRASASLSEPIHAETCCIGVVAFFPGPEKYTTSRLVIPRKQWARTNPVAIEIADDALHVRDLRPTR